MDTKKEKERHFVQIVADSASSFPKAEIIDHEEPDFLVNDGHEIIGIEVTQIFHKSHPGQPPQQLEDSERQKVTERACTLAEAAAVPPLMVSIRFGAYPLLAKRDREVMATAIVDVVKANVPLPGLPVVWTNDFDASNSALEKIDSILMLRMSDEDHHHWQCGRAGFVNTDFADELQLVIDGKEKLVDKYLQQCDRCWLVVAAEWRQPSTFFEFSPEMASHVFSSRFDRVYFVDAFSRDVSQAVISSEASGHL